ncbi:MAG TPA: hypothetical protein VFA56_14425 [Gaiellaceae bacterium]|nr:hypothetical protein [Gaiellaceae bacterium]
MNAVAVEQRKATPIADRILTAVPLTGLYLWLSAMYAVEAWRRITPWLFTDELEMTQIARSIAATGHPARRGEPYTFRSLYTIMTAPLWWIDNVGTAYAAIKYVDVFVMTAVVFPAYFLARMLLPRGWSLFVAAGAAAIPPMAYSSWLVEETLAYPYVALCLLLIAKAFVHRSRGWVAAAAAATVVAPLVRGELVVIPITVVLALAFAVWSSAWARERRRSWSRGDYLGFFMLVAGLLILISGYASHHSNAWYAATQYYKHRIIVMGDWAAGALAIGTGVLPMILGLAALVPVRGEERSRELRMVRCVGAGAIIAFGLYTGMKAAYLSTVFETRVVERNLIYIAPLLFLGTALVLHRRRVNVYALAGAAAYVLYLVVGTPLHMNTQLYSDSLGFAILQQANRFFEWTPTTAQNVLLALFVLGLALTAAVVTRRVRAEVALGLAGAVAVGLLAWNVTGEIAAAAGTASIARDTENALSRPFTWVDDHAHGKPTLYLAQGVADPTSEWLLEFWNRSISGVSSLDSTIGGPGPAGAPNITTAGQLYWTEDPVAHAPGKLYDYAVEDRPCVDFAGTTVAWHTYGAGTLEKRWRLVQLTKPNRLRSACTGIYPDGWSSGADSSYFRFLSGKPGWLRIRLSRSGWSPTPVQIQLGSIASQQKLPVLGHVLRTIDVSVPAQGTREVWVRTPPTRFAVHVVVERKFVPRDVDPKRFGDPRTLGALVDFRYVRERPRR